jgi:hypothetical protein
VVVVEMDQVEMVNQEVLVEVLLEEQMDQVVVQLNQVHQVNQELMDLEIQVQLCLE